MSAPSIVYDKAPPAAIEAEHPPFGGKPYRGGRVPRRWSYDYASVAALAGVQVNTVRQAASARRLDMADLLGVARWIEKQRRRGPAEHGRTGP